MFYLAAAILLVLAALFVLRALLRPVDTAPADAQVREDTMRALYRDRLAEIDREAAAGQISAEDRAAMEAELGAVLLADFEQREEQAPAATRLNRWLLALTPVVAVAAAVWVYLLIGDPGAEQLRGGRDLLRLDPHKDRAELLEWQQRLSERVAARGGDSESWYLLGHTELLLGEYQRSATAFSVAASQIGPDPGLDMAWLQARYMAQQGRLDDKTREIAERIMARDPNQPLVLELFAVDAFRQGRFQEAVSLLNRALAGTVGTNQRAALQTAIVEARKRLGDLTPSIDVNIAAEADAPRGATLFVIARPVGGGMPYAVVRRPATALPVSIRLDDAVSMNPDLGLSTVAATAGAVEVVVRLSLTGAPMAHPGDWQWQSDAIELADLEGPLALDVTLTPPTS